METRFKRGYYEQPESEHTEQKNGHGRPESGGERPQFRDNSAQAPSFKQAAQKKTGGKVEAGSCSVPRFFYDVTAGRQVL